MVRFCCEHCGGKISVHDKYIGKRGKCPECGAIVVIPAKSNVITFHCQSCDRKINVPKTYAGKEAQCPNCKDRFIIPTTDFDISPATQSHPDQPAETTGALTFLDVPQEYKTLNQPSARSQKFQELNEPERKSEAVSPAREDALVTQRRLPWPIDIFLYPTSFTGLKILTIIIFIPLFIGFILRWIRGLSVLALYVPVLMVGFIVEMFIYLYSYWYFCECIRDSAFGGVRAPETFGNTPRLGDLLRQLFRTIACFIVISAPTAFYYGGAQQMNAIFWVLLAIGLFVFPMAVLAVIILDSLAGLNPVLLIGSIFSVLLKYCGLVLLATAVVLAAIFFSKIQETEEIQHNWARSMFWGTLFYGIWLYAVFVVAHLFGRFYWRHQEKLNWEV